MERASSKSSGINNAFYDTLGEEWHEATAHPIALLRAENALRNPWIEETIRNALGEKASIVDIGCGAGLLTNYLAKKGHRVFGVDLSEKSLQSAQKRDATSSVIYQKANASALPFPDESFDAVSAMDLLEHVENPEQVISEASRVLKKGGLFFFHTFSRNFLSWLIVIKGVEWAVKNTPPHMHVYSLFLNPLEVKRLCTQHQLEILELKGVRPDFASAAFWKMLLTRTVPTDLRFIFTPSLTTGYSGYAKKD